MQTINFDPNDMIEFCNHVKAHPELFDEFGHACVSFYRTESKLFEHIVLTTKHLTDDGMYSNMSMMI